MTTAAFLPCRAGSKRVPRKNVRPFGPFSDGLIQLKLLQLLDSQVSRIVVSSDDEVVLDVASRLADPRITLHERDASLGQDSTSTDELVPHAAALIEEDQILWTHVTSPFVDGPVYDDLIDRLGRTEGHDSLMTVNALRSFIWNTKGPVNYDRSVERWPRTQTIEPLYEVNSAAFIAPRSVYVATGDRIGARPLLAELDHVTGFDIDWPDDFELAELLATRHLSVDGSRVASTPEQR